MKTRTLSRRGTMRLTLALAVSALLPAGFAGAALAAAPEAPLPGQVLVILAKEAAGPVDPELKKLEALQKPPFNAFKSMKVLDKKVLTLTGKRAETANLPNGRRMSVEVLERKGDGRFKLKVSITKPDASKRATSMIVVAVPGEPFFVAGPAHEGGTLIIGIQVGKRAKK